MPGIIEKWSALDYALRTVRLINADQFWTDSLSREDLTGEEIGELAQFANSEILDPWLHLSDGEVVKPVQDFVATRTEVALRTISRISLERVNPIEQLPSSVGALVEDRHREAEVLTDKIKSLQGGNWQPGDLTPSNVCHLLIVASATAASLDRYDLAAYILTLHASLGCDGF
ncbi:hypothetical protein F0344_13075 [Streptomyces finlayi]|uniref:Uncharacterized protein n=1 Tax=Streptomyces finlayi TaxID=67296 RepID=A0A7G7BJB3_9ACTN|nr:hypothetical protein [Streptomyces finlayi]QNE75428.1 hypothetical protein F0344_13075 [Streptomyces finlayi]